MIKSLEETRDAKNIHQHGEDNLHQVHIHHLSKQRETQSISTKITPKKGCLLSIYLFNTSFEVLARATRQPKEMKEIHIRMKKVR